MDLSSSSGSLASSTDSVRKKELKKPKVIKHYQLGDKIGKGQYGEVSKAIDTNDGSIVAIKNISIAGLSPEKREKIKGEFNLLKSLSHPNIIRVLDSFETEDEYHIVLEYIENGSLYDVLKKHGEFPEHLVRIYIKHVLEGLAYLHEQGIIHRDIKGSNVLLKRDSSVVLADFGTAVFEETEKVDEASNDKSIGGTPYWLSPEAILLEPLTTESDIWSVGCLIIELLTAVPPYYHLTQMQALFQIVRDEHPPIPEEISADLQDLLLSCFQKDTSKRPSAKKLLEHKWFNPPAQSKHRALERMPTLQELTESITEYKMSRRRSMTLRKAKHVKPADMLDSLSIPEETMQSTPAMELYVQLTTKLETVTGRAATHEAKYTSLTRLQNLLRKFSKQSEFLEMMKKVENEKLKTEQTIAAITNIQKTLMLQISKFKQGLFPKARAIKDHYYPAKKETEEYLSLLQGEIIYILRKKSEAIVVGENFITGKQGLVETASIEIVEQPQITSNNNNDEVKQKMSNEFLTSAKETLTLVKKQESAGKLQKFFGESAPENVDKQQASGEPNSPNPNKHKRISISMNGLDSTKTLKKRIKELEAQLAQQEKINSEIKVMLFRAQTQNEELLNQIKELKQQK